MKGCMRRKERSKRKIYDKGGFEKGVSLEKEAVTIHTKIQSYLVRDRGGSLFGECELYRKLVTRPAVRITVRGLPWRMHGLLAHSTLVPFTSQTGDKFLWMKRKGRKRRFENTNKRHITHSIFLRWVLTRATFCHIKVKSKHVDVESQKLNYTIRKIAINIKYQK